ncbi:TFIIH and nucleotide excision repair factor 3 complexes subunit [Hortaea werneckii]|uniref:RNA polymerase II transcription factor B subunit 2 n=1 Tax=Hortaea werneckii TaxID=91943 RepID=A0A3M7I2N2_HORWE|nr:TFIIH and nucleotide excision repair factor 3 complexes subunit [Hortaea werneckii]KAI6964467.1 TFIIH and nucleotide excision repair factor 3 complexes subunit [Hortaea werneckii]KAI7385719.1 TFIIH and nucleotide excision repair factor 3 complexes subunit [Hortaea werneckii]KAI7396389.1 TFIIH and nucleotide excision repair factor 3 complexes subunit [Hortaea werneckii]KAI7428749.1 TFIIH and nucleotide excision repair factor 3 complexes subunit [Hortaea werneckii]
MSSTASQRALDYLEQLPGTTFTKLYQQPSTALAIFRRMLPHLAKTLVMAMLYMPTPLNVGDLERWVRPGSESLQARDRALSILQPLRILFDTQDDRGRAAYKLSDAFARSLQLALTGGGNHRSFGVPCSTPDEKPVSVEYLDTFARKQWEAILYYVVGSANAGLASEVDISAGTKQLLQKGEFVALRGRTPVITQSGFTFLLQEINAQIWTLLIVYLEVSSSLQMDPVDVLSFLFTLGSLELGISYSTSNLTPTQQQMLEDLSDFGLVYRRSSSEERYYPTRLATTLTSDAPALPNNSLTATTTTTSGDPNPQQNEKGYIILETNYRLYAYTSSPLLISILSLFSTLHTRYPNLVCAKITKTSVQSAIAAGITSDQIVTYLTTHAHPILRSQTPILPPTVVDQIRLWQIEGERMTATKGFLIYELANSEEYERAVKYAEALGVLRKEFRSKGSFFVSRMDQMKVYFRNVSARKEREKEVKREEGGEGA